MEIPVWFQMATDVAGWLGGLTVVVTVIIYVRQRQSTALSEKQANRSRLTEAYMNVNAHVLSNDDTITVASNFFNRGAGKLDKTRNQKETAIAIEIFHLKLNALFLEWNYRKAYPEDSRKLKRVLGKRASENIDNRNLIEFRKTFEGTMRGFAKNGDINSRKIIHNISDIFPGFPDEFMNLVKEYFNDLDKSIRVDESLHLQNIGDTTKGIEWLKDPENMANVKHIYNTVFYRHSSDDPSTRLLYEKIPQVDSVIRSLLDLKCIWEDIYIEDQSETIKRLALSLTPTQRPYYHSWRIKTGIISSAFPLLQVLLITYEGRSATVLFGWTFRGGKSNRVYVSSGEETTEYFMDYIRKLQHKDISNQVVLWDSSPVSPPAKK